MSFLSIEFPGDVAARNMSGGRQFDNTALAPTKTDAQEVKPSAQQCAAM
jgi:hypothetical protein